MFPSRRWISASVVLALLAVASLAVYAASAPVPPAPPTPPTPPAPPAPEVQLWTDSDFDMDAPLALAMGGDDFMFAGDDGDFGSGVGVFTMSGGMGGGMSGWTHGELADRIKLTDDQRGKIDAVRDRQQRSAIQMRADLQLASMDLRDLMSADKPDRNAIDAQIDKISSKRAELRKSQVRAMLDMRDVLTPQQRQALKTERDKMRAEARERRGHREVIKVRSHPMDTQ